MHLQLSQTHAGKWQARERWTLDGDYDEWLDVEPVEGRNADEMEIVRMTLTEVA